jgi:hypothetical protein
LDFSKILESVDSRPETQKHIDEVRRLLSLVSSDLHDRGLVHDHTKLNELKDVFDEVTPKLKGLEYGSEEYKKSLRDIKPAIDYHYSQESHHVFEHFPNGVHDATLMDVVEMVADWCAAAKRHDSGDAMKSLEINRERFGIEPQLFSLLKNTVVWLES